MAGSAFGVSAARAAGTPIAGNTIPSAPRRVVAVDSRISLEMALALELPLVGYSHSRARPWVPVPAEVPFLAAPPDPEQILALAPDLILCPDTAPQSEWWPLEKMRRIAPVLTSDHRSHWRDNIERLAAALGRSGLLAPLLAEHAGRIDTIRRRHAQAISAHLVVAASYDPLKRRLNVRSGGTGYGFVMPAQVLTDLRGHAVGADKLGFYGEVALESFGSVLGDVDGILLIDMGGSALAALAREPLWQRLPAVSAGRVEIVAGNCVFGSFYTARYLAYAWEALFTRLNS
ncbi:ABC transporter substrate-binding protein [Bosea sp. BH3]|uniref:ABC transporter substrate-binding protein n=1 Tax=Bosea sp. BH3 TaxID=2871701 RepID=UPI0021CB4337|nr:ABC transporter substrate-binding protein [Bosea sp. BH3]MCU4178241.1 ABC transporter substrate-binding protein [Bosea sp. BH3]